MYQAWVVQKFNGTMFNVLLGDHYETEQDAREIVDVYEKNFGKCERKVVEPSGTPIPEQEEEKETLWQKLLSWFE